MLKRRKRNTLIFLLIFVVLAIILIYLANFNSGLKFEELSEKQVEIKNESLHFIRDIKVYLNERLLLEINELKPNESKIIDLSNEAGIITLKAFATYHVPIETKINLNAESELQLILGIKVAEPLPLNKEQILAIQLCNQGKKIKDLKIMIKEDPDFISVSKNVFSTSFNEGECKDFDIIIKGLKEGNTLLTIQLILGKTKKEFSKTLNISS